MPYFNHTMARSIKLSTKDKSDKIASVSTRHTRSMPATCAKSGASIYKTADRSVSEKYKFQMTQRKMLFMRSLLRAQVDQLSQCNGPYPVETMNKLFAAYQINYNLLRHEGPGLKIYDAKNMNAPELSLMVRIYLRSEHNPNTDLYLKMLRHLGRKHPYIIHTWEMFYDDENVYIFQEYATKGNLVEYMQENPPVTEKQAAFWAKQIYRALDFLGDLAIAHRDLAPIHLVVKPMVDEMWLKLTGFKHSIIYWDIVNNDIQFCNCVPLAKQQEDGPNFQPPEVYGNPETEQFDPIQADIWSYGANIYFMLAKQYPYNLNQPSDNIDDEIWHNVSSLKSVTDNCKQFMFALMRMNANDRMPFDFIERDPWFIANTKVSSDK